MLLCLYPLRLITFLVFLLSGAELGLAFPAPSPLTLRELVVARSDTPAPTILSPKFTRKEVVEDHLLIDSFRDHKTRRRKSDVAAADASKQKLHPRTGSAPAGIARFADPATLRFHVPLQNKRLTPHTRTLAPLSRTDPAKYLVEKALLRQRVLDRKLASRKESKLELELLDVHDVVMSCGWERPLPYPFDDDQCTEEELLGVLDVEREKGGDSVGVGGTQQASETESNSASALKAETRSLVRGIVP